MNKIVGRLVVFAAVFALVAVEALAHSAGHGSVSDEQSVEIATSVVASLTERDAKRGFGKLAPTWAGLPAETKKIHVKRDGYVIVSIRNDSEGKTLYVLMSDGGEVLDANLTGKFSQLEKS